MEEKLVALLKTIHDTYEDFYLGIPECCESDEECKKLIDFVRSKKDVTSSEVIDYYFSEIEEKR